MFHTFTATKTCNFFGVFARFMKKNIIFAVYIAHRVVGLYRQTAD